ncbi:MAG: ComEC/Rec2 family competence protein [Solirubrobacteraceae bacterium]
MKRQPFLYLLIALIVGILFQEFVNVDFSWVQFFAVVFVSLIISFACLKKKAALSISFLLLICFFIGVKLAKVENHIPKNHYSVVLPTKNIVQVKLLEKLKPNYKYNKYFAQVNYLLNSTNQPKEITGKILIYLPKENKQLYVEDELLISSGYYPVEFTEEYKNYFYYLKRKGILGKLYVKDILAVKKSISWKSKLEEWKEKTTYSLQKSGYNQNVVALIQSLLFGDRSEINQKVMNSFQNLGVIHILSISGLHTSIIYAIVFFVFDFFLSKIGKRKFAVLFALLIVVGFTFFVGLKPPVLRTTLMLLLYFGSYFLQRKSNIYHTLYLSAFILLVFSPNFLFDLGFQLSYLAVFFIVWLYDIFKISITKNKIINYFLDIISVSFSAQIGTLPLIIYNFHSFSLLFLIGNLIFIPFSFGFIVLAFIALIFTTINLKFYYFTLVLNQITNFVLTIGINIGGLERFVFNHIQFNFLEMILSLFICFLLPFLINRNYNFKIIYTVIILILLIEIF